MTTTTCRSCGASIIWTRTTATGNLMPVDATPDPDGNVVVDRLGNSTVSSGPPMFVDDGTTLHLSHFVTCPQADEWRKS